MKLPNAENAVVAKAKIFDYLLASTSKSAHAKERFFSRFGFRRDEWKILADALRKHGQAFEVDSVELGQHGTCYIVVGELLCPDGRQPLIRAVWMVDDGSDVPRLITAYPFQEEEK